MIVAFILVYIFGGTCGFGLAAIIMASKSDDDY